MTITMNSRMIGILVRKDLSLLRQPVLLYVGGGALSIAMMGLGGEAGFYAGSVLLISTLMALSFHPAMATVVGERKDQNLAFVMSMPITATDYTWAKLLANLLLFFVPWAVLLAGTLGLIAARPALPDGLMPFAVILFGAIAASAVSILFVAIVSESMQLTIAVHIACTLIFQAVMYGASHTPAIAATMHGEAVVWNWAALAFLGIEAALAAAMFAATLWLQSRKTDFI